MYGINDRREVCAHAEEILSQFGRFPAHDRYDRVFLSNALLALNIIFLFSCNFLKMVVDRQENLRLIYSSK